MDALRAHLDTRFPSYPPIERQHGASLGGISAQVAPGGPVHDVHGTYAKWFAENGVAVVLQRPDYVVRDDFVVNVAQRYFVTPRGRSTPIFDTWALGGLNNSRSETELRLRISSRVGWWLGGKRRCLDCFAFVSWCSFRSPSSPSRPAVPGWPARRRRGATRRRGSSMTSELTTTRS